MFLGLDFSAGFSTIYRNFDGLEYVVIAKSLYLPKLISELPNTLPPNYYASHFPGFSLLILLFSPALGFLKSMLFTSVLFTIFSAVMFYFLVRDFKLTNQPLLLSLIFLILPARWVIVHSVGSSEPVFIFFVILCFYFVMKFEHLQHYSYLIWAALAALAAQLTRPPGLILLIALGLYVHWKYFISPVIARSEATWQSFLKNFWTNWKKHLRYSVFILVPLGLLAIFYWYSVSLGDFWAYFHSGDNIHLVFPPFQVFNKHQFWVGEIWLEDIVYIFVVGFSAGMLLWKQKLYPLAFFVLTYFLAATLVVHRDISRYTLPAFPFVLIAFEKFLTSKEFKIVLVIVALGIYLYSQNFIIENVAPIPNLSVFN